MISEFVDTKTDNNFEMLNKQFPHLTVNNINTELEYENSTKILQFSQCSEISDSNLEINPNDKKIKNKSIFDNKKIYQKDNIYDPILDKDVCNTLNLKNKQYPELWENYVTQRRAFWTPDELDFSRDYENFVKLDNTKKNVVKMILAFFANMDSVVNMNISKNIISKIYPIEIIMGFSQQVAMENIHIETYTTLLEVLIKDDNEKNFLFDSIKNINSVKLIADWAFKWIDNEDISLSCKIVAFACVEGILFSSAFAFIFWLKEHSMGDLGMEGLFRSNEFISRDEGLHKDYGVLIFKRLKNKPSQSVVIDIIKECVSIGEVFNKETIKNDVAGLSSNDMDIYIKYVADRLCYSLIGKKIYNAKNPFPFMETIGMQTKTNFHESRNTEYKNAYSSSNNTKLTFVEDF
jgi:ribonucleoside-diphosphate reductase subunit M2